MKAMVVRIAREALVAEDREVPQPGRAEVRIRVHACGVCPRASGPGSGCRAFPGMRWRAWSMRSARACLRFVWETASAWDGMEAMMERVRRASTGSSSTARTPG